VLLTIRISCGWLVPCMRSHACHCSTSSIAAMTASRCSRVWHQALFVFRSLLCSRVTHQYTRQQGHDSYGCDRCVRDGQVSQKRLLAYKSCLMMLQPSAHTIHHAQSHIRKMSPEASRLTCLPLAPLAHCQTGCMSATPRFPRMASLHK